MLRVRRRQNTLLIALLYNSIRKEALLTSQIEGTQATLTDLFDKEAGLEVSNTDDVEEVTSHLLAFHLEQPGELCRSKNWIGGARNRP